MLRDYAKRSGGDADSSKRGDSDSSDQRHAKAATAQPLRELQRRWSKVLARCYELHADGGRCHYEDDPDRRFNCTTCERRDEDAFCQANLFLKRVVKLVAAYLAEKKTAGQGSLPQAGSSTADTAASEHVADATPPPPLTQEQIDAFKAVGLSVEIETPLRDEHVWLVPQRTNAGRLELTPEEINFLVQTTAAFEGRLVDITRDTDENTDEHTAVDTTKTKTEEEAR